MQKLSAGPDSTDSGLRISESFFWLADFLELSSEIYFQRTEHKIRRAHRGSSTDQASNPPLFKWNKEP